MDKHNFHLFNPFFIKCVKLMIYDDNFAHIYYGTNLCKR